MGENSAALALAGSFTYRGKHYQFAPPDTFEVIARYEDWMVERAYAELRRARPHLSREEYAEERTELRRDITAGLYGWNTVQRQKALQTGEGQQQLMLLMLRMYQPDLSADVCRRIMHDQAPVQDAQGKPVLDDDGQPLTEAVRIVRLMLGGGDPNSSKPETTTPATG